MILLNCVGKVTNSFKTESYNWQVFFTFYVDSRKEESFKSIREIEHTMWMPFHLRSETVLLC